MNNTFIKEKPEDERFRKAAKRIGVALTILECLEGKSILSRVQRATLGSIGSTKHPSLDEKHLVIEFYTTVLDAYHEFMYKVDAGKVPDEIPPIETLAAQIRHEELKSMVLAVIYARHEILNTINNLAYPLRALEDIEQEHSQDAARHLEELINIAGKFRSLNEDIDRLELVEPSEEIDKLQKTLFKTLFSMREQLARLQKEAERFAFPPDHEEKEKYEGYLKRYYPDLAELFDMFITYAQTGKLTPKLLECDINKLMESEAEYLHKRAERNFLFPGSVDLVFEFATPTLELNIDERLLKIVIRNLHKNAVHAIASDRTRDKHKFKVRTFTQNGETIIEVSDTGIGIEKEDLPHIFDFLWTKSKEGGTGAGLALTKEAITQLGGTIDVESELGKGTTFTMRFPARTSPVSEAELMALVQALTSNNDFARVSIWHINLFVSGVSDELAEAFLDSRIFRDRRGYIINFSDLAAQIKQGNKIGVKYLEEEGYDALYVYGYHPFKTGEYTVKDALLALRLIRSIGHPKKYDIIVFSPGEYEHAPFAGEERRSMSYPLKNFPAGFVHYTEDNKLVEYYPRENESEALNFPSQSGDRSSPATMTLPAITPYHRATEQIKEARRDRQLESDI